MKGEDRATGLLMHHIRIFVESISLPSNLHIATLTIPEKYTRFASLFSITASQTTLVCVANARQTQLSAQRSWLITYRLGYTRRLSVQYTTWPIIASSRAHCTIHSLRPCSEFFGGKI